ncbi:hypothetical protein ALC60_05394, partial [Trachymyrmex zeteki]
SNFYSIKVGLSNTARESKRFHLSVLVERDEAKIIKDRRHDSPESPSLPPSRASWNLATPC